MARPGRSRAPLSHVDCAYAGLVERLALLEARREGVLRLNELRRNLELVDYKIGLYRERLAGCGTRAA